LSSVIIVSCTIYFTENGQKIQISERGTDRHDKSMEMLKLPHHCPNFLCICPSSSLEESKEHKPEINVMRQTAGELCPWRT